MLDIIENLFIWCLYLGLPTFLMIRHFGGKNTVFLFASIFAIGNINAEPSVSNQFQFQTLEVKRKKFDLVLHRKLEAHFPDWPQRMDYQKEQEKLYKSAMQKRREALKLRTKKNFNRTKDEQDAIAYFQGTGFYAKHQDPQTKPNIFDTRQSFLLKMHVDQMRNGFLNSSGFKRE